MTAPVIADPLALPIMRAMLVCLEDQARCVKAPPLLYSLRVGDIAEFLLSQNNDECCDGIGWVRNVTTYPSTNFPDQDSVASNCGPLSWAVVLEIGIARCAPTPEAQDLTTAEEWDAAADAISGDAAAIRRAVATFKTLPEYEDTLWLVGAWLPLPTEGGCMGGAMQVTIQALPCDPPGGCPS